jgi:plastocyanin
MALSRNNQIFIGLAALAVTVLVIVLVLRTAGIRESTTSNPVPKATVQITDRGFEPEHVTIKVGDTVAWLNTDAAPHRVAANPYPNRTELPELYSSILAPGHTYGFTFARAGTFHYHDYLHPSMNATIEVQQ